MPRGRLIKPLWAEIARLDTAATAQAGGYDPDFRTTKVSYPGGVRTSSRVELPPVQVLAQVEMATWEQQQQQAAGNQPDSRLTLAIHYRELEKRGLIDPTTREALFRVNDRLVRLLTRWSKRVVQTVRVPAGGLYATQVAPGGLGLGGDRNLLIVTFDERAQGLTSAPA